MLAVDASTESWSAELHLDGQVRMARGFWPPRHRDEQLHGLEMGAALLALEAYGPRLLSGLALKILEDKSAVEHLLRSGSSRAPVLQQLLRSIWAFVDRHRMQLVHGARGERG